MILIMIETEEDEIILVLRRPHKRCVLYNTFALSEQ